MKKLSAVLLAAAALLLVACGPEAPKTIKIGTIQPLTGAIAVYGKNVSQAVTLAVEEVNAAGGINGKTVELITEDDSFKPDNTVAAFKKLVTKDKVLAVVGALTSNCTLAITNLAQGAKVPLITPTSTNDKVTTAGDFIFQACYKDSFQGKVVASFAASDLGAKTAAVLFDKANDYSSGLKGAFEGAFTAAGGTVVAESYNTNDKDFNAQIAKIKTSKPDVIFLPDYYNAVSLLSKQIRAAGIKAPPARRRRLGRRGGEQRDRDHRFVLLQPLLPRSRQPRGQDLPRRLQGALGQRFRRPGRPRLRTPPSFCSTPSPPSTRPAS